MAPSLGTRSTSRFRQGHIDGRSEDRTHQQDIGMSKRVVASCTFTAATRKITAAGGTFAAFAAGDDILVEGNVTNAGRFHVNATDASTYLTCDQGLKNEGPLTVTIRSI